MIKNHNFNSNQIISGTGNKLLAYLRENKTMELNQLELSANGSPYVGYPINKKLQFVPTFLSDVYLKKIENAIVPLTKLIRSIPGRFFNNDYKSLINYHSSLEEKDYLKNYSNYMNKTFRSTGRMDFIMSEKGLKCLEFNAGTTCGTWQNSYMLPIYHENKILKKFFESEKIILEAKNTIQSYLEMYVAEAMNTVKDISTDLNFYIYYNTLDFIPKKGTLRANILKLRHSISPFQIGEHVPQLNSYRDAFRSSEFIQNLLPVKANLHIVDRKELFELKDSKLFYDNKRVHVLLPFSHFLEMDFPESLSAGNLVITEFYPYHLLANKLYFSLMSENVEHSCFSEEEKEIIRNYVPWTRRILPVKTQFSGEEIFLNVLAENYKDLFVIKEAGSFGGKGVYVGKDMDDNEWSGVVTRALKSGNYILQEYVESLPFVYLNEEKELTEHRVVWAGFVTSDEFAGGCTRVQEHGKPSVINVTQGSTISFIVNESRKNENLM